MSRSQLTGFNPFGNFSMDSKMNAVKMETGKSWVHLTADPLKIQFNAFVHEKITTIKDIKILTLTLTFCQLYLILRAILCPTHTTK